MYDHAHTGLLQVPDKEEHKSGGAKAASMLKHITNKLTLGTLKALQPQQQPVDITAQANGNRSLHNCDAASKADADAAHAAEQAVALQVSASLPFRPVTLVFRDVRYWVPNPAALLSKAKQAEGRVQCYSVAKA